MADRFKLVATSGRARLGEFETAHGSFQTPAFMPVGTQATVKGLNPEQLTALGAQVILVNAYHLSVRPGDELIHRLGGVHRFMGWSGPILSDSGGFQVYSLSKIRKVSDDGVSFRSHVDGAELFFSPERVVQIQDNLGVDIMMVLDECVGYPAERSVVERGLERTLSWARLSKQVERRTDGAIFGIVQGGFDPLLRRSGAQRTVEIGFDGYAIGGLSVGEPPPLMYEMVDRVTPELPGDKVRYLMGVGTPTDLVQAVALGVDLFDCVIPTRSARFGRLYTGDSFINIRNGVYREDAAPIDSGCDCYTCCNFSRAYLAHLIHSKEVLGVQLATTHNLRFYHTLMTEIRNAISTNRFDEFRRSFLAKRGNVDAGTTADESP